MSKQLGNISLGGIVDFKWHTKNAAGSSVTRDVAGTIRVYKDNGTTSSTTGVSDTVDFNGVVGLHHCRVDLSDGFYSAGSNFQVVVQLTEYDSQTVNMELAEFSIEHRWENTLNNVSLSEIMGYAVDGSITASQALANINAYAKGKILRSGTNYAYRNNADSATLFTNQLSSSERTPL